jgi:hypothetical protein
MKYGILLLCAAPSFAAEIELPFATLERIVSEQVFTQDGRKYVRGAPSVKCQFAYLEKPRIGSDNGLLRVQARFSGRSAVGVLGGCVGLGDSFDLTLAAAPVVKNGAIAFKDVRISTGKDSFYIRRVRAALAQAFQKDLKIEVKDQARKILEQGGASYKPELAAFDLTDIRVKADALVLVVEFRIVVH